MNGTGPTNDEETIRRVLNRRADLLAVLLERPLEKPVLAEELDVSRSTVDRAIRRLETNGLVRREGGSVTATLTGRLAYDAYRQYCDETEDVARHSDLLAELPPTAEVGHEMLEGATAYRSDPPATGRPANEITALITRATRLRACVTVINDSAAAEQFARMVTERGGKGTVVYTSSLADLLRDEYFQLHHEMASTGRFRAFERDHLPYELFLIDTDEGVTAAVLIYSTTGTMRGALVNSSETAVEWARERFESFAASATEFTDDFHIESREEHEDADVTDTESESESDAE